METARQRDAAGLVVAGVVNTLLAPVVAGLVLGPGMPAGGGDAVARAAWISANAAVWQAGWAFWLVVTLTFAWSYLCIAPHLAGRGLATLGMAAAIAALAVDLVGITVALVVTPSVASGAGAYPELFVAADSLAHALVFGVSFGVYSLAGLLLAGAARGTHGYPGRLAVLGWVLWGCSAVAAVLLGPVPALASPLLLVGILLYGPWAWWNARWVLQGR